MNINTIINCFNLISKETTIPNKRGFILATNNKGIDKNIQFGTIKNRILNIKVKKNMFISLLNNIDLINPVYIICFNDKLLPTLFKNPSSDKSFNLGLSPDFLKINFSP